MRRFFERGCMGFRWRVVPQKQVLPGTGLQPFRLPQKSLLPTLYLKRRKSFEGFLPFCGLPRLSFVRPLFISFFRRFQSFVCRSFSIALSSFSICRRKAKGFSPDLCFWSWSFFCAGTCGFCSTRSRGVCAAL